MQFAAGLLVWAVAGLGKVVDKLSGVRVADTVHVLLFICVAFISMHVYLSSSGHTPSAHFKSMITG